MFFRKSRQANRTTTRLKAIAPLLGVVVAAAIFGPSAAMANAATSCVNTGDGSVCDNAQINASPPVSVGPPYVYMEGQDMSFGRGGFGGGHR